jgi:hypothetical protein
MIQPIVSQFNPFPHILAKGSRVVKLFPAIDSRQFFPYIQVDFCQLR